MKWRTFKEKLPELGTNILCVTEEKKIAILEVNLASIKYIKNILTDEAKNHKDPFLLDFYDVDQENDDPQIDLCNAIYWAYPDSIKLPKEKCVKITHEY